MKTAVVTARVDAAVKEEAVRILATYGLTISQAVNMLMAKLVSDPQTVIDALFKTPTEETRKVLAEIEAGVGLTHYPSIEAALDDLRISELK